MKVISGKHITKSHSHCSLENSAVESHYEKVIVNLNSTFLCNIQNILLNIANFTFAIIHVTKIHDLFVSYVQ